MKTIEGEKKAFLEVKKSKFIAILKRVDTKEEITNALAEIKKEYPFAKHYVYAYILEGEKKYSDDAEPSKTAGAPILNVLEMQELEHILCIVVRYFGGILLGASGLVRAYTKSATEALKEAQIVPLIHYYKFRCTFAYNYSKQIDYLLRGKTILEKQFQEEIQYIFLTEETKTLLREMEKYAKIEEIP